MLIGVITRGFIIETAHLPSMAAHTLLPANADILVAGLLAAVLIKTPNPRWEMVDRWIRVAPLGILVFLILFRLGEGSNDQLFQIGADLLVSIACAIYLLSLVRGTPEAKRYESKVLCFFGNISYAVYLTHLPILGLMHGFILDSVPDLTNLTQLTLESDGFTNLTLPAGLTGLKSLELEDNQLSDFNQLSNLTSLVALDLGFNSFTNFSLPGGLTNLSTFYFAGNPLTDVTLPPGLAGLTELNLSQNLLTSVALPVGMTNLIELELAEADRLIAPARSKICCSSSGTRSG